MKPEAQRIAIAEACGWRECRCEKGGNMPSGIPNDDWNRDVDTHKTHGQCGFPVVYHREDLPDYLNDLNAMHEALKTLTREQRVGEHGFMGHLWRIVTRDGNPDVSTWNTATATAAQRAEAFLKAIGKWV